MIIELVGGPKDGQIMQVMDTEEERSFACNTLEGNNSNVCNQSVFPKVIYLRDVKGSNKYFYKGTY